MLSWLNMGKQRSNEESKKAREQREKAERIECMDRKKRGHEILCKFKQDRSTERHEFMGTFKS